MEVVVVMQSDPSSMTGRSSFKIVAIDEEAAMSWIQDEVDGKHSEGARYATGKTAKWWVETYPVFQLRSVTVEMGFAYKTSPIMKDPLP